MATLVNNTLSVEGLFKKGSGFGGGAGSWTKKKPITNHVPVETEVREENPCSTYRKKPGLDGDITQGIELLILPSSSIKLLIRLDMITFGIAVVY